MSQPVADLKAKSSSTVILVTRNGMGTGDVELQHRLLGIYFRMLLENEFLPGAICFYADGVKMVIEGSPVLNSLRELEQKGVHLIICNTCLQYYGLADKVAVGIVGGMHDIVLSQWMGDKVITL